MKFSTAICPFESGKCGKEGKKSKKFEYLENEKSFLDEIKNIFHSFSRASRWLIVESPKLFRSYDKHFWISPCKRNCQILIGLCK